MPETKTLNQGYHNLNDLLFLCHNIDSASEKDKVRIKELAKDIEFDSGYLEFIGEATVKATDE